MEGLADRLSEMIAVAEETRDAALILQAFELGRSLGAEEAVLSRLVGDEALPWPLAIFMAVTPSEAAALVEARLWLCACTEDVARRCPDPVVRRILSDNVRFARSVIRGEQPAPTGKELAERALGSMMKEHLEAFASANLLAPADSLPKHARWIIGEDDEVRELAVMGLRSRVTQLRAGLPAPSQMHRALCQHFWSILDLSAAGSVVGISDARKLDYLIEMARLADPDALRSALSAFRWTESAYVLLRLLTDAKTAEAVARGWATDCLARMADPPEDLLNQRSPSLLTIRCARAARAAAESPSDEHAWQHRALMAAACALV